MKKIFFIVVALLLNLGLVSAISQKEINEAKSLIDSKVDCRSLSDSQLEIIGEYYMEQMHPGKAHELMHQMMGLKEGSETEEQFHINMAKIMYCDEDNGIIGSGMRGYGGMMPMMRMMMGSGMTINPSYGMMGNNPMGFGYSYWSFWNVLYTILVIGLIILVYLGIIKLWKNMKSKDNKK